MWLSPVPPPPFSLLIPLSIHTGVTSTQSIIIEKCDAIIIFYKIIKKPHNTFASCHNESRAQPSRPYVICFWHPTRKTNAGKREIIDWNKWSLKNGHPFVSSTIWDVALVVSPVSGGRGVNPPLDWKTIIKRNTKLAFWGFNYRIWHALSFLCDRAENVL